MLEIGLPELILIAIVGLLVIGPERLPETLRTLGLWMGRMRRSFTQVKAEIEKEIGMDEVKRQLHNEAIMEEMKRIEAEVRNTADTARTSLNAGIEQSLPPTPSIDPNVHNEVSDLISAQDGSNPPVPAAAADERDHTDAGKEDERDHTDAGAKVTTELREDEDDDTDRINPGTPETDSTDNTDPDSSRTQRITSG
jgi:sec-independent protein translocase protein TatB